ncbi:MAG: IS110 family transposase [Pseudomonadota bacterium]
MIHAGLIVGIDVSKARLDVHVHPSGEHWSSANGRAGIAGLAKRLAGLMPAAVGMEASGGYEQALAHALHAAGFDVHILPPARVRAFARAIGQGAKTDALDAMMIARCLEASRDRLVRYAPDPARERLSALGTHRRRLIAERNGLASQLDTIAEPVVRRMIQARLRSIALGLACLDKAVRTLLAATPRLQRQVDRLCQAKGVGPVLAGALVADMTELGHISAKAAAALIGDAPHARQSGASARPGRCGGRKALRDILYMATLSAIKARDPILASFYKRLREKGKPFKLTLVAVMRKMITILNAIARDDPAFHIA